MGLMDFAENTGPNPTRAEISAAGLRKLFCSRARECLEVAILHDWPGLSCRRCPVDEPLSDDDPAVDAERCRSLRAAAVARWLDDDRDLLRAVTAEAARPRRGVGGENLR